MFVNGHNLLTAAPIKDMLDHKATAYGTSYGLSELGYDIRIKQDIRFSKGLWHTDPDTYRPIHHMVGESDWIEGSFCIASAIEEFDMPDFLGGLVKDKSTWARRGLSLFNTVIEPGFQGGLTLELVYHGQEELHIPAGAGIAQVLFSPCQLPARYAGKYQGQSTNPEPARFS